MTKSRFIVTTLLQMFPKIVEAINAQYMISLRDEFAMAALTGLLAGRREGMYRGVGAYSADALQWTEMAYTLAQAMLNEREKRARNESEAS